MSLSSVQAFDPWFQEILDIAERKNLLFRMTVFPGAAWWVNCFCKGLTPEQAWGEIPF